VGQQGGEWAEATAGVGWKERNERERDEELGRVELGFRWGRLTRIGKNPFYFKSFMNFKLIWIEFKFKLQTASTHKTKYKSTQ
jgi:hypothetical protein